MANIIVSLIILLILLLAVLKIVIEKRRGSKCIGCHLSSQCSSAKGVKNSSFRGEKIEIKQII